VLHHHEHVDGSGYPHGLRGDEIPLESRIILVADAFEAMTADRPYSPAIPTDQALAELDSNAGIQFDPACVKALRSAIAADEEIDSQADAA
jgi:HD-GYP domain-containing protein (c-di-GMP phosphodiesterase class II)